MSATQKVMGHVYAIFTILVWGSCFVLTKQMLTAYTAIQIIPLRMGLAYITLWALRPKTLKLPWKDELMFILIGVTGGSFYFFLQNTALTYTFAANVSIIIALSPILTVILAQLFSRNGERLGKFVYIGAVIAIAGVVLVVLNGQLTFHLNPLGDLIALAAALMWAVYSILIKKYTEQYDNFLVTRRVMLWAFITAVPLMLLTDGMPDLHPLFTQTNVLLSWLFLGVFGNAVCFAIWNIAFQRLGVVITNNYLYASPFVTLVVGYLLLVDSLDEAADTANEIASEHLEILTQAPFAMMTKIRNAGAIFLGEYSSEPLGDYFAGPNHVLPTNGTARFFSPLNVDDFLKKTSIISYSRPALEKIHQDIECFAENEGLTAHANSIRVRFEKED